MIHPALPAQTPWQNSVPFHSQRTTEIGRIYPPEGKSQNMNPKARGIRNLPLLPPEKAKHFLGRAGSQKNATAKAR